jgi:hypothetical protein
MTEAANLRLRPDTMSGRALHKIAYDMAARCCLQRLAAQMRCWDASPQPLHNIPCHEPAAMSTVEMDRLKWNAARSLQPLCPPVACQRRHDDRVLQLHFANLQRLEQRLRIFFDVVLL